MSSFTDPFYFALRQALLIPSRFVSPFAVPSGVSCSRSRARPLFWCIHARCAVKGWIHPEGLIRYPDRNPRAHLSAVVVDQVEVFTHWIDHNLAHLDHLDPIRVHLPLSGMIPGITKEPSRTGLTRQQPWCARILSYRCLQAKMVYSRSCRWFYHGYICRKYI